MLSILCFLFLFLLNKSDKKCVAYFHFGIRKFCRLVLYFKEFSLATYLSFSWIFPIKSFRFEISTNASISHDINLKKNMKMQFHVDSLFNPNIIHNRLVLFHCKLISFLKQFISLCKQIEFLDSLAQLHFNNDNNNSE